MVTSPEGLSQIPKLEACEVLGPPPGGATSRTTSNNNVPAECGE